MITVTLRLKTLRGVAWCGVGVALGCDDLIAYCNVACHGLECHGIAWHGAV